MKTNLKISEFSRFLVRSGYVILVKVWKWLKLLNSALFIKKTLVNQVYIRIWSFWLNFTVLQQMKKNSKMNQYSRFLLRWEYTIQVKIWKRPNLLNCLPFIKKTLVNQVTFEFDHFDWLSQFYSEWRKTPKSVNIQDFCKGPGMRSRSKFDNN